MPVDEFFWFAFDPVSFSTGLGRDRCRQSTTALAQSNVFHVLPFQNTLIY